MKRRGFLSAILKAGAAFSILPAAATYKRLWVPKPEFIHCYEIQFWWSADNVVSHVHEYPSKVLPLGQGSLVKYELKNGVFKKTESVIEPSSSRNIIQFNMDNLTKMPKWEQVEA